MKRTKKEFTPYNEYHDRPFELKWATAFALGELQEGIEASDEYSKRAFERLPQQTTEEIEEYVEPVSYTHLDVYKRQVERNNSRTKICCF